MEVVGHAVVSSVTHSAATQLGGVAGEAVKAAGLQTFHYLSMVMLFAKVIVFGFVLFKTFSREVCFSIYLSQIQMASIHRSVGKDD